MTPKPLLKSVASLYGFPPTKTAVIIVRLTMWRRCACTLLLAAMAHGIARGDDIFRTYEIDSSLGIELGRGFDILTNSPRNQCVTILKSIQHPEYGPDGVDFKSYRVENSQQLDRILGISASASIKAGIGEGTASAAYTKSLSVSQYTLNYVVESSVRQKGPGIDVQDLQDRYKRLLSSGNSDAYSRYRAICGDGYISELVTGGVFRALIQISTNSRSESEDISVKLGGSYASLSGAAAFSNAIKEVTKSNEVRIWSFRRGAQGPVPITPEQIATDAANLPVTAKQSSVPLQVAVYSYLGILDDPMLPLASLSERAARIDKLAALSAKARDRMTDVQYIIDHPSQFFGQPSDLINLSNELHSLITFREAISIRADQCVKADGICYVDDLASPPPLARPARKW